MTCMVTVQDMNVVAIRELHGTNGATVDVFPVPAPTTENCGNDELHGKGVVFSRDMDGLCLACALPELKARAEAHWGTHLDVEVYA